MAQIDPVLTLDALVPDRPVVLIKTKANPKGTKFELKLGTELSLEELKVLEVRGNKAQELMDVELDEAGAGLLDHWLLEITGIIFHTPVPDDVYSALTNAQRLQCLATFTEVCLQPLTTQTENQSNGAK